MLVKYRSIEEDTFYKELTQEVYAYFKEHSLSTKANRLMLTKAGMVLFGTTTFYLLIVFGQLSTSMNILCLVLLGLSVAGIGLNISHDALHGAFSSNARVNDLLGYTMDAIGCSSYLWKINHGRHHAFTNIRGLDGDIKDSKILRLSPHAPYHPFHRYQVFSVFVVYALFYLLIVYWFNMVNITGRKFSNNKTLKHPWKDILWFVLFKLFYLIVWIVIPLLFMDISLGAFLTGYLILNIVIGVVITSVFFLAHTLDSVEYKEETECDQPIGWAEHQLRTTANFKTNPLIGFFLGGLNYQIEHHLFPKICSIYYPKISPIIKKKAMKYNIPYHESTGFGMALRSHFRLLKRLSYPEVALG